MSKKDTKRSAVIVGASLAGLMTGIALSRAGFKVTILERASAEPRSGAVLQVDSGETDFSPAAKYLRKLASGGLKSAEAWSSVHARLKAAASDEPGIDLRYDTRIQTIDQNEYSAWVLTDNGETFRAEVVIGADGHRSTVRRVVALEHHDAAFAGYMIWVALLDEQSIPEKYWPALNAPVSMPNGIGDFLLGSVVEGADGCCERGHRRLGWAWYDNTRNSLLRKLGCLQANVVQHSLNGPAVPEQTLKELTQQATARWPQPWLAATLHSIRSRNLTGIPISEYVPDRLVNGRIALAGDAAHVLTPITAMGFNASLQDAAALADCLKIGPHVTGTIEALLEYESYRLNPVRQLVRSGQVFSRSFGFDNVKLF